MFLEEIEGRHFKINHTIISGKEDIFGVGISLKKKQGLLSASFENTYVERSKWSECFQKWNGNTDASSGAPQMFSELKTVKVNYKRKGLPQILNIFP